LELLMWPRSVVGRRAKRPTAPGRSGMSIAEVRRGKAALAVARDRFTWSPKSGSSSEVAGIVTLLSHTQLVRIQLCMAHSSQILPADVKRSDALESPQSPLDEAHAFYAAAQRTTRRSNLISVASLLFSTCAVALSVTLGGGSRSDAAAPAQRLVAERAVPKALNPDAHYVRLEELSIYRDQIVAGAIGTAELGDASVSWPDGAPHGNGLSARPFPPPLRDAHTLCTRSLPRVTCPVTCPCLGPR
jgi:hypothetical protein